MNTPSKTKLFERLKNGLQKTRTGFSTGLANLLFGKKIIDDQLLDEIEDSLIQSDIGIDTCKLVISDLMTRISRHELEDSSALFAALKEILTSLLQPCEKPLRLTSAKPYVILVVGVNGAGKTTTIGKLAKQLQKQDLKVMLAAGDTFRAAAIEQLQVWGERNNIGVIAQQQGADSASVAFDAYQAAQARGCDVLIVDTAGRLHTKSNLMEELKKVKRILAKLNAESPHEIMLILDAGTGQNAIQQAKQFHEAVGLTSIVVSKLDGTAKGGVIFAIANNLALPIPFIGIGETIDDLRTFNAQEFVDALFAEE